MLGDRVRDVEVVGDRAYLATGYDGLIIIDLLDRTNPFVQGSLDSVGFSQDVEVVGDVAYVAESSFGGAGGLIIVDVSNPMGPVELARVAGSFNRVDVKGNLAYPTGPKSGMEIIDVTQPAAPVSLGGIDLPGFENDVFVDDGLAYVPADMSDGNSTLRIVDVSFPTAPVEAASIDTYGRLPFDVNVSGGTGYIPAIGGIERGLIIYDLSDPLAPSELSFLRLPSARDVAIAGERLMFAFGADSRFGGGIGGVRVIDASHLDLPVVIGSLDTGNDEVAALDIETDIDGDWIFAAVSGPQGGLRIYRVSNCPSVLSLDVAPSSEQNTVAMSLDATIQVLILGSDSVDVADLDLDSIRFGPAGAASGSALDHSMVADTNGDGRDDIQLHFGLLAAGFAPDDQQGCVEGLLASEPFIACDWVDVNQPPELVVSLDEDEAAPTVIDFDASGSFDPEGGPLEYLWMFADGSPIETSTQVTREYLMPGTYEVTVSVFDDTTQVTTRTYAAQVDAPYTPMSSRQITFGSPQDSVRDPKISHGQVVWWDSTRGNWEVYLWGEAGSTNVSNDPQDQESPSISGARVAWSSQCSACTHEEIFLREGGTLSRITNNSSDDRHPDIDGGNLVWQHEDLTGSSPPDWEIYYDDGVSLIQLTDNETDDVDPAISGSSVVWRGEDGIYRWDGSTTTLVSGTCTTCENPDVSGTNVVWQAKDGDDLDIFLWDGSGISQITNNDFKDRHPAVSGDWIVWEGGNGSSGREIYRWDGAMISQLTNNDVEDRNPDVSSDQVAWIRTTGTEEEGNLRDEVFVSAPAVVPSLSSGLLLSTIGLLAWLGSRPQATRAAARAAERSGPR